MYNPLAGQVMAPVNYVFTESCAPVQFCWLEVTYKPNKLKFQRSTQISSWKQLLKAITISRLQIGVELFFMQRNKLKKKNKQMVQQLYYYAWKTRLLPK